MKKITSLLVELDKLKSVYRMTYLSDISRTENSAEHSWHLAVALMALKDFIPETVDIDHAIKMALLHDVCEIGAGDISVYDPKRGEKAKEEAEFMQAFAERHDAFGKEASAMWYEYEEQVTAESRWVKVVDRLLPFILNLATEGKRWQEQGIARSQVLGINHCIEEIAPELFEWMKREIDEAVKNGWLKDA
ncbi:HD family hydrolase [uncultured Photobacterium sp.]|uniref:HD domain-containing protein n=1 Tax=uncultured Photobacterium sp. TaxID=173973 RepID=UPI00261D647A|nr:HD domain-containing protein [uncultured Photobacterium sp.]